MTLTLDTGLDSIDWLGSGSLPFLKIPADKIKVLSEQFWISSVGDLLQMLDNAGLGVSVESMLGIERTEAQALQHYLYEKLPEQTAAMQRAPQHLRMGAVLDQPALATSLSLSAVMKQSILPDKVALLKGLSPIVDQGDRGTCVSCATTAVHEWYQQKFQTKKALSIQQLYYRCKQQDKLSGAGTYLHVAASVLQKSGQCLESTWAYNPSVIQGNEAQSPEPKKAGKEMSQYQIKASAYFSMEIQTLKALLAGFDIGGHHITGRPVLFGLTLYPTFMGGATARTGKVLMPLPGEISQGGHAMVLVGYQTSSAPGGGYFLVRNSWGKKWARDCVDGAGYCHIPFAYFKQYGADTQCFAFFQQDEIQRINQLSVSSPEIAYNTAESSLLIGQNLDNQQPVSLPMKVMKRHVVAVGSTGSGKTVFCKLLCEQMLKNKIPVIAIDPQGDLVSMATTLTEQQAISQGFNLDEWRSFHDQYEAVIFTPESSAGIPICANPFANPLFADDNQNEIRYAKYVDLLAEVVVNHLKGLPKTKQPFFQGAVSKIIQFGLKSHQMKNLDDFAHVLFDLPETLKPSIHAILEAKDIALLVRSVTILLDSPARYLFDFGVPLDLDILTGKRFNPEGKTRLSIIYLNSLSSQSDKTFFVSLFAENLYQWLLRQPTEDSSNDDPRLMLFMDEVGAFIPNPTQKKPVCKDILLKLFKEGRKFGLSLLAASQTFSDFDYKALGQANTMNIGRLKQSQEHKKVESFFCNDSSDVDFETTLSGLKAGEFYLWSPDVDKKVIHYQANLPVFSLETLIEDEIKPLISESLRQRFTEFYTPPSQLSHQLSNVTSTKSSTAPVTFNNDELTQLQTENQQLKKQIDQLKSNTVTKNHETPDDVLLALLDKSHHALAFQEIMTAFKQSDHPIQRSQLQHLLKDLLESQQIVKTELTRKTVYYHAEQVCFINKKSCEHVITPVELNFMEAAVENMIDETFTTGLIRKVSPEIKSLQLISYPLWRIQIHYHRSMLFMKTKEEDILYLDALKQQMLFSKKDCLLFNRNLEMDLDDYDDAFEKIPLGVQPEFTAILPKNYQNIIDRIAAEQVIKQKYKVTITDSQLMFLPVWFAELVVGNDEKQDYCIDALFGKHFSLPVKPDKRSL